MAESHHSFIINFTMGGVAASISKTSFAPIERIKLLLQTQALFPSHKSYKGITDCFIKIIKEEGFLSLWRGNLSNIVRYFPNQALNFALNDKFNHLFCPFKKDINPYKFAFGLLMAGGMAGITSLVVIYPLDFIRTRLAVDFAKKGDKREFDGILDCMRKIYRSDGVGGLYKGFMVSSVTYFFYRAIYFGGYDVLKQHFLKDKKKDTVALKMQIALTVTNVAGFIIYPLDTVRRRLMMQSGKKQAVYNGTLHCIKKMLNDEGWRAFYRGAWSNVIRNTGSSLVLVLYDEFQKIVLRNKGI